MSQRNAATWKVALQAGACASLLSLLAVAMLSAPVIAYSCTIHHHHTDHQHGYCVAASALVSDGAPQRVSVAPLAVIGYLVWLQQGVARAVSLPTHHSRAPPTNR